MYNWNTNATELKKDPQAYAIWRLEQLINFGLHGEKINRDELIEHWGVLWIDPKKKACVSFLV